MYIFLLVVLLVFAILDAVLRRNMFVYFSAIVLALIAGLRGEYVGVDTKAYISDYNAVTKGFAPVNSTEVGYLGLEKIFAFFHSPVWLFLLVIAIVTFSILCFSFICYSGYFAGFMFAYYYARFFVSRDFDQIRSSLAAALILLSLKYIKDKKPIHFLLIILVGNLIHSGTIIALVIYPLYSLFWKKIQQHILGLYSIAILIFIVLSQSISPLLQEIAISINKGSVYITNDYYTQGSGLSNPVMWMQIIISLFAVYLAVKDRKQEDVKYKLFVTSYMISTLILVLFNQYRMLGGRMSTIFATVEPLVILLSFDTVRISKTTKIVSFCCLTLIIFILINYIGGLIPQLYPYYVSI